MGWSEGGLKGSLRVRSGKHLVDVARSHGTFRVAKGCRTAHAAGWFNTHMFGLRFQCTDCAVFSSQDSEGIVGKLAHRVKVCDFVDDFVA